MKYLITGGTGLIGQKICQLLLAEGHEVSVLSRSQSIGGKINYFKWDLEEEFVDPEAVKEVDCLIHLAGSGIADKKWTRERKTEIIDSRVKPLQLLLEKFKESGQFPKTIVSASAVGIYGFDTGDRELMEGSNPGKDYISEVVLKWEKAIDEFSKTANCRAVKLRIGIVLDKEGGALPKLALPVKLGVGSPIGKGKQWISWIHSSDLIRLFYEASIEPTLDGAFNAVSPNPSTNEFLVNTLGRVMNRPIWFPNIPAFVLKLLLGERAQLVLGGNKVSSKKIQNSGFRFEFDTLEDAIRNIYKR